MSLEPPSHCSAESPQNGLPIRLTSAQADYLEIIYEEQLKTGVARGCSIAQSAGVTRATVAATMRSLKALGLIDYEPYGPVQMTDEGLRIGRRLHRSRQVLERFFSEVTGLPDAAARRAAQSHMAAASPESIAVLEALTRFIGEHDKEWHQARKQALLNLTHEVTS